MFLLRTPCKLKTVIHGNKVRNLTQSADLPYVHPMSDFPTTERNIFRDFPDVFSPEYKSNAEQFAAQMEPLREDRNLIGYFLRNEPEWAFIKELNISEELLETDFPTDSRDALIHYLTDRHLGDMDQFNAAWHTSFKSFDDLRKPIFKATSLSTGAAADLKAFSRIMVDRYVRIPSLAGRMTNLPVMIGEFHFGGLDRGLSATGIRGAANQAERGRAYRFYTEQAASSPFCVGVHYFQYNDQPTLGRYDGENYNIGLVDVCQTPHHEFLAVEGGADTVLDALTEFMADGLLVLPTHTWDHISPDNPYYSVSDSPSCVGILTELFRKCPDVNAQHAGVGGFL